MPPVEASDLTIREEDFLNLMRDLSDFERKFKIRKGFNLFEALNITRQEIRHSRFLAYLLDPNETHGLHDKFLRAILLAVINENSACGVRRLSVALGDLSTSTVYCERDHFDITVQIPTLNLLLVIENKVGAAESEAQLETYRKRAMERYGEHEFLGCFLTPTGYEGSDENWSTLSYGQICSELTHLSEQETLTTDVRVAVQHYIELVQRKIMASPALIQACREIYIKHRAAIDLIMEHGQQTTLASAFDLFAETLPRIEKFGLRSNIVFFHHQSWLELANRPQASRETNWTSDFPVRFWFRLEDTRLSLFLQVGPLLNPASQDSWNQLVQTISQRFEGKTPRGTKYARVSRVDISLNEDSSVEEVAEAMRRAWNRLGGGKAPEAVSAAVQEWIALQPASLP